MFQVENTLYRIPDDYIEENPYFQELIYANQSGRSDEHPLVYEELTRFEIESLLAILSARFGVFIPHICFNELNSLQNCQGFSYLG